jgi:hypothetical protein
MFFKIPVDRTECIFSGLRQSLDISGFLGPPARSIQLLESFDIRAGNEVLPEEIMFPQAAIGYQVIHALFA